MGIAKGVGTERDVRKESRSNMMLVGGQVAGWGWCEFCFDGEGVSFGIVFENCDLDL